MTLKPLFSDRIVAWYQRNGRKDLPWQHQPNAYRVLVSEMMLQQTQVTTVIPYFNRFMITFPDLSTLAKAPLDQVLQHWSGLGYYARARYLHRTAQMIVQHHKGIFPSNLKELMALPGLGRSTASAILALSYNLPFPILDGNVKRVLARYSGLKGWPGDKTIEKQLWQVAETLMPQHAAHDYTQGMMDLGALICLKKAPLCPTCPLQSDCYAYHHQLTEHIPSSRPIKVYPQRTAVFLLAMSPHNTILLTKRPPSGIWGGLFIPPQFGDKQSLLNWLKQQHFSFTKMTSLPKRKHLFTHFALKFTPIVIHLNQAMPLNFDFYSKAQIDTLALPTPIKKLLSDIMKAIP